MLRFWVSPASSPTVQLPSCKRYFLPRFFTHCNALNENVGDLNFQVNRPLIKRMNAH